MTPISCRTVNSFTVVSVYKTLKEGEMPRRIQFGLVLLVRFRLETCWTIQIIVAWDSCNQKDVIMLPITSSVIIQLCECCVETINNGDGSQGAQAPNCNPRSPVCFLPQDQRCFKYHYYYQNLKLLYFSRDSSEVKKDFKSTLRLVQLALFRNWIKKIKINLVNSMWIDVYYCLCFTRQSGVREAPSLILLFTF